MKTHSVSAFLGLCAIALLSLAPSGYCQTPVILAPLPQLQFFDQNGVPLAFGCVFTYSSGTTSPLATYTDSSGTTQNQNPVILSPGGSANIWLKAGLAYTMRVKASGGSNCAAGSQQYTVNGIGGGVSVLTTAVTFSSTPVFTIAAQLQLFTLTLTGDATAQPLTGVGILSPGIVAFQITQDGSGGHAFTWPANSVGGCPITASIASSPNQVIAQQFFWNGVTAYAIGPCVIGTGPALAAGSLILSGNLTIGGGIVSPFFASSCLHPASVGVIRLCNTDAINWRNAANNADFGLSSDATNTAILSHPGGLELTGTTPNVYFGGKTASFPFLKRNATALNVRLADDSADAPLSASDLTGSSSVTIGAVKVSGVASAGQVPVASSSTVAGWGTPGGIVQANSITVLASPVSVAMAMTTTVMTKAVTMPAQGCPCRALVSYGIFLSVTDHGVGQTWIDDGTNQFATNQWNVSVDGNADGSEATSFSTGTYANNAMVTFTMKINTQATGLSVTVNSSTFTAPQASWMNVAVFTSN